MPDVEEGQFLYLDVALFRQTGRRRRLANQAVVREVLAGRGDAGDVEIPLEMVLDLAAGTRLANIAQVIEDRSEHHRCRPGHVTVDCVQRRLHAVPGLPGVEQISVNRLEE